MQQFKNMELGTVSHRVFQFYNFLHVNGFWTDYNLPSNSITETDTAIFGY